MQSDLYNALLDELKSKLTLPPDQPDETAQSTLAALWHAAAGDPCSSQKRPDRHTLEDLTETQQGRFAAHDRGAVRGKTAHADHEKGAFYGFGA